jgi:hypothetical protein
MKYMLLINVPRGTGQYQHQSDPWAPEDWRAHLDYWDRLNGTLAAAGELVEVQALTPPAEGRLVRAGRKDVPATDGPFPETKEFLAGYWIVDVQSAERAYAMAAEASAVPGPGGVPLNMPIEVRQVMSAPPAE